MISLLPFRGSKKKTPLLLRGGVNEFFPYYYSPQRVYSKLVYVEMVKNTPIKKEKSKGF
jgi:hypothetical protein